MLQVWFNEHFRDIVARPQGNNPTFPVATRWRHTLGRKFVSHEEVLEMINKVPRNKVKSFNFVISFFFPW